MTTPIDWTNWGDALNIVRAVAFLIPLATALLTKLHATSQVKSLVTLILTVLLATISTLATPDGDFQVVNFFNAFINAFVVAVAAYYGLLKPAGATGAVARATAKVGVGSNGRRDH